MDPFARLANLLCLWTFPSVKEGTPVQRIAQFAVVLRHVGMITHDHPKESFDRDGHPPPERCFWGLRDGDRMRSIDAGWDAGQA